MSTDIETDAEAARTAQVISAAGTLLGTLLTLIAIFFAAQGPIALGLYVFTEQGWLRSWGYRCV